MGALHGCCGLSSAIAFSRDPSSVSRSMFCCAEACTTISSDTQPEMTRAVEPSCAEYVKVSLVRRPRHEAGARPD